MNGTMFKIVTIALLASATPALAATDRATAISTMAALYRSVDVCGALLDRTKLSAYADSIRPAGDALFNVDLFRATRDLDTAQKTWTKDQTDAFCQAEAKMAQTLGVTLQ
jgi:hypothetical protein